MLYIGVIGGGHCSPEEALLAKEVGQEIASRGAVLLCGGRGGIMEAAACGAWKAGGLVVGILPGRNRWEGNDYLTVALATGLGDARNAIITCASDVLIAISGGYGTLSEIGLALKMDKPVIGLSTWELSRTGQVFAVHKASSPREAVELAFQMARWNLPKKGERKVENLNIINVSTTTRAQLVDITDRVKRLVEKANIQEGICYLYVPHTTAAITINENADPTVAQDILAQLDKMVPWESAYRHREGNAAAHIKASILGASQLLLINNGRLVLGTWQGIFFCEFDGPRERKVFVKLSPC